MRPDFVTDRGHEFLSVAPGALGAGTTSSTIPITGQEIAQTSDGPEGAPAEDRASATAAERRERGEKGCSGEGAKNQRHIKDLEKILKKRSLEFQNLAKECETSHTPSGVGASGLEGTPGAEKTGGDTSSSLNRCRDKMKKREKEIEKLIEDTDHIEQELAECRKHPSMALDVVKAAQAKITAAEKRLDATFTALEALVAGQP